MRSVEVEHCAKLKLGLDFLGVNPSNIPLTVSRCGQVLMDFIIFDPQWSGSQTASLNFHKIENVTFYQLHVDNTALVSMNIVFGNILRL